MDGICHNYHNFFVLKISPALQVPGQQAGPPRDRGALGLRLYAGRLRRTVPEQRPR